MPVNSYLSVPGSDLGQDYLASLLNPIDAEQRDEKQRTQAERKAGGLEAINMTSAEDAQTDKRAEQATKGVMAGYNEDTAKLAREDRLNNLKVQDTLDAQGYQAEQSSLNRNFEMGMDEMRQQFEKDQQRKAQVAAQQGQVVGGLEGIGGAALMAMV